MSNLIVVGIADYKIAKADDVLITYALGSCIGTCIYDNIAHMAGLSHILLPNAALCQNDNNIMKYADTAIASMVKKMEMAGASRFHLTAKIAGGAKMFPTASVSIGERNIVSVKSELQKLNIRITAEDVGSDYGRTVEFHADNGTVLVKSVLHGNKTI